MRLLIVGDANAPRTLAFQRALAMARMPAAECISYREVLRHGGVPRALVRRDTVVRFDAPSRDTTEDEAILGRPLQRGQLIPRREWFRGFRRALDLVQASCANTTAHPDDIEAMFDKLACRERLLRDEIPMPRHFGIVTSFEQLRALGAQRLFLKPTFGSSGAGIVAIALGRTRAKAWTTVEEADGVLFNTRRIRVIDDFGAIARLVDALTAFDQMHAEAWVPKAGIEGKQTDMRAVIVAGNVTRIVARASTTPITNLHLLNERIEYSTLHFPPRETLELVADSFPSALSMGIDVAFTSHWRSHVVFEVNAFGDYVTTHNDDGSAIYQYALSILSRRAA